ncbi:dihydroorotate dehydrogenase, partial [bacterium]|nr:dihydroorotate dehydrogenase [bacterium]MCD6501875.1 dihydroorotate dehydrogenase [bacterium]
SLEERMACGIGVCQGCVVPTKDGYKRVCKDGPVFRADEIEWEATDD